MLRIVFFFTFAIVLISCNESADEQLPNFVIVFVDDMGYGDVGCYGGDLPTPNLDKMALEGVRFTDFYVAQPVCGASRAALLTGCYPNRVGIHGAPNPRSRYGINKNEMTIAELLKQKEYATGMYGKWHLGHHKPFLPVNHGFDEYFGTPYSNDMWPLHPDYFIFPTHVAERKRGFPPLPVIEGDSIAIPEVTPEVQAQFTTMFTERATDFIIRNQENPFFVYLAHPMPHVPIYASDKHLGKSGKGLYGDVIMEIDWSVGRINKVLDSLGLAENTMVIFASDNGPWVSYGNHSGTTGPLREAKGTTWEGGVRVPCMMKWKGVIPAGSVCKEPAMTIDIMPTFAGITGTTLPEHKIDGQDIWPLIIGNEEEYTAQEAYYFYWIRDLEAVRSGDWKLHYPHKYRTMKGMEPGSDGMPGQYSQDSTGFALYNLRDDIGETEDVAVFFPAKVDELKALGDKIMAELGHGRQAGYGNREPGRLTE